MCPLSKGINYRIIADFIGSVKFFSGLVGVGILSESRITLITWISNLDYRVIFHRRLNLRKNAFVVAQFIATLTFSFYLSESRITLIARIRGTE